MRFRVAAIVGNVIGNRIAVFVPVQAAIGAPRQTRHITKIARAQALPLLAVVREEEVSGNLKGDEADGKDVGGLVELPRENLGTDIFPIAFAVDILWCGPGGGKTEVADLEHAFEGDEDVGGLQVQVDEIGFVYGTNSLQTMLMRFKGLRV